MNTRYGSARRSFGRADAPVRKAPAHAAIFFALAAASMVACRSGGDPAGHAAESLRERPVPCADIVLTPGSSTPNRDIYFTATRVPSVVVDLTKVPELRYTRVDFTACGAQDSGRTLGTRTVYGVESFVVDPVAVSAAARHRACWQVTATAFTGAARPLGVQTARVHQGDAMVRGFTAPPTPGLALVARVGDAEVSTTTHADGSFRYENMPAGYLGEIRGADSSDGRRVTALGRPGIEIPTGPVQFADVRVDVREAAAPVDTFEPDDVATVASQQQARVLPFTEAHTLTSHDDVDLVPVTFTGSLHTVAVENTSGRPVAHALRIVDAAGNVLARSNAGPPNYEASPSLRFSSRAPGLLFIQVSRLDHEPQPTTYRLTVSPTRRIP